MRKTRFIRFVALRYLKPRRKEGFTFLVALFSFLGMALGVATLIIVMSVMNGFEQELFKKILGVNGHITIEYFDQSNGYEPLIEQIKTIPNVTHVTPLISGQVLAQGRSGSQGAYVRGIKEADFFNRPILKDSLVTPLIAPFEGKDVIILGYRLAENLHLQAGDYITLITPERNITPFGTTPRSKTFLIIGTANLGMYEYDSSFVFMPLAGAQIFFKRYNRISEIEILAKNPYALEPITQHLTDIFAKGTNILPWQTKHAGFHNVLKVEQTVMFVILTLIILVAAFNIISSLIMMVRSKSKDIAILRTIGANPRDILRIFMLSGALIGITGTCLGT